MTCWVCGGSGGVRRFAMHVDGEALRLQPALCEEHGDQFLMRVGVAMGEALRGETGESGRPVPEPPTPEARLSEAVAGLTEPDRPDITISGRPEEAPPLYASTVREFEAARRDLPDQLAQHRGRGAEFPIDDATYVVEVTGKRCTACQGSGTVMVLAEPHKSDLERPETCELCRGSGWL